MNRLGAIKVPTLILVGEFDTTGTLAMATVFENEIHCARKVVIPGTAHMLPLEQPAIFNQLVLDFMRSKA